MRAVTSILFLLLKHLKINHVYQFEHLTDTLVDANCIVLILKLLNQNIETFITAHNSFAKSQLIVLLLHRLPTLPCRFPQFELFNFLSQFREDAQVNDSFFVEENNVCHRNFYVTITLLRILQVSHDEVI